MKIPIILYSLLMCGFMGFTNILDAAAKQQKLDAPDLYEPQWTPDEIAEQRKIFELIKQTQQDKVESKEPHYTPEEIAEQHDIFAQIKKAKDEKKDTREPQLTYDEIEYKNSILEQIERAQQRKKEECIKPKKFPVTKEETAKEIVWDLSRKCSEPATDIILSYINSPRKIKVPIARLTQPLERSLLLAHIEGLRGASRAGLTLPHLHCKDLLLAKPTIFNHRAQILVAPTHFPRFSKSLYNLTKLSIGTDGSIEVNGGGFMSIEDRLVDGLEKGRSWQNISIKNDTTLSIALDDEQCAVCGELTTVDPSGAELKKALDSIKDAAKNLPTESL